MRQKFGNRWVEYRELINLMICLLYDGEGHVGIYNKWVKVGF